MASTSERPPEDLPRSTHPVAAPVTVNLLNYKTSLYFNIPEFITIFYDRCQDFGTAQGMMPDLVSAVPAPIPSVLEASVLTIFHFVYSIPIRNGLSVVCLPVFLLFPFSFPLVFVHSIFMQFHRNGISFVSFANRL